MDWDTIKEIGYGALNLKPEELGKLTHGELQDLVKGYIWREESHWKKLAQLASWVTAPHVKKPINPEKLLGKKTEGKKKVNPDEGKAMLNDLVKEMG